LRDRLNQNKLQVEAGSVMETQPVYWAEPLTWEFEARITQKTSLGHSQFEVTLDKSYFYPTGGGQPHDTGTLGEARVVDVFRAEDGTVVHRVVGDISGPLVTAQIDRDRRLGHMQHHSAQHIVSRALEHLLELETLSARISADSPSTVDVSDVELSSADLTQVERLANQLVFENRPIKTYFITEAQLETVPLRRPPKVSGQIRVVEVEAFDYSACGGTHCPYTGMIGLIKIVKTERKNKKLRLHFVAGQQALTYFRHYQEVVTHLCQQLNTRPEEVVSLVNRQVAQLAAAERELRSLRVELLPVEARQLNAQAASIGAVRLVTKLYPSRSMSELRELAKQLPTQDNLVAVLGGYEGQKLTLVVSCAAGTGISAHELLAHLLAQIHGQGSGDARLAQGGGNATPEQVEQLLAETTAFFDG
jgi:alanyl-tRNA synthetase